MDLLERYLQAIGPYLPAETKDDTLAELRANLLEQMDARAEELGRPLVESDVAAILKAHGKPEVVALRYLPQRSLIGPTIFPFYMFTLRRVIPFVVFGSLVARSILFMSSHDGSVAHALVDFAMGLIPSLLLTVAIITVIFAAIEQEVTRGKTRTKWNEWDPMKLPGVKPHVLVAETPRSVAKRVIDLAVHCLWFAYVLWVPWHPFWIMGPGVFYLDSLNVAFAPVWHTFYVLLIVLLSLQLAIKLIAFVPAAQGWLKPLKLATDLLGLIAIGWLAWSSTYFVPANTAADLHQIAVVNHSVNLAFRVALVVVVAGFVLDTWKYVKRAKPMQQMAF